ncbi:MULTISPECIES: HU family DNA-binding protein [Proteiniphilum]|jgi:nucleoid DNA-binding protein|uniref:HU family DNA-binding protein n=1 Tax=Proteiniphilum TaxID=294702 RepID=UPI001EEABD6E|nr:MULTISPECIES: HU family DNA-binding protein [Proteiniphilum]ULB34445.1 HU family DNA-binding protein [Proteiniphilum propionicum]
MTNEDLIAKIAQRLDWTDIAVSEVLDAVIDVVKAELLESNRIIIDDFGVFFTRIQSEYILVDSETNDRYLIPPVVEVDFEMLSLKTEEEILPFELIFTPDVALNEAVNISFSHFEPTLLNEGVDLPGIQVVIPVDEYDDLEENDEPNKSVQLHPEKEETAITQAPEITLSAGISETTPESAPESGDGATTEAVPETFAGAIPKSIAEVTPETTQEAVTETIQEPAPVKVIEISNSSASAEVHMSVNTASGIIEHKLPVTTSRSEKKKRKKRPTVLIPVLGGLAIALAALFFFRGVQTKKVEPLIVNNEIEYTTENVYTPRTDTVFQSVNEVAAQAKEEKKIMLEEGKTLRLLALELFGNKEFWVYIYLENKKNIQNPNIVPSGTYLLIPDPSTYRFDLSDPQSVAEAKALGDKVLNECLN